MGPQEYSHGNPLGITFKPHGGQNGNIRGPLLGCLWLHVGFPWGNQWEPQGVAIATQEQSHWNAIGVAIGIPTGAPLGIPNDNPNGKTT